MLRRIGLFAVVGMLTVVVLAACGKQEEKAESTVTRVPATNVPVVSPTPGATTAAASPAGGSPVASPGASPAAAGAASPAASVAASPTTASPVASPGVGGTPAAPSSAVTVNLEDIKFDPKELTIPAGTDVTITLVNKGASVHTFDVDALGVKSGDVAPGATKAITVNAPAGDYQYYCAIPGHKEAGMVGTLHVVAGAPAAASPATGGTAPEASPGASAAASPAASGSTAAQTIELVDIKFQPNAVTIPANTDVTITLVNKGAAPHTFDIDALNIHTGDIAPGATKTVTINAAPGSYEYYCAIPGHKQAGMTGTLTVQ